MNFLDDKFAKLGVDNAPGEESRQQVGLVNLRGAKLEGIPVDFSSEIRGRGIHWWKCKKVFEATYPKMELRMARIPARTRSMAKPTPPT